MARTLASPRFILLFSTCRGIFLAPGLEGHAQRQPRKVTPACLITTTPELQTQALRVKLARGSFQGHRDEMLPEKI